MNNNDNKKQVNAFNAWNTNNKLKIVIGVLLVAFLLCFGVYELMKKNDISENKKLEDDFKVNLENTGRIFMENLKDGATTTVTFKVTNDSEETKLFDLQIGEIKNELSITTNLVYDLYINGKEEIAKEYFPVEEMILIDGEEIAPKKSVEYKMVITYQNKDTSSSDLGKTISGKLSIVEE